MTDDFLGLDVRGIPELGAKLDRFPKLVRDAIVEEVNEYLVNVFESEQPTPDHAVTRAQAYTDAIITTPRGKILRGYFSYAQYRKVMAMANAGLFPYHRTQEMRRSWRRIGEGEDQIIVNETDAAIFTMDDERQARLSKLVGWKTIGDRIRERSREIGRRAVIGARQGLKAAGLQTL